MKYNIYKFTSVGAREENELSWYPVNMEYLYQINLDTEEDAREICNHMTRLEHNPSLYPGAKEVSYWYDEAEHDVYPYLMQGVLS